MFSVIYECDLCKNRGGTTFSMNPPIIPNWKIIYIKSKEIMICSKCWNKIEKYIEKLQKGRKFINVYK